MARGPLKMSEHGGPERGMYPVIVQKDGRVRTPWLDLDNGGITYVTSEDVFYPPSKKEWVVRKVYVNV